jgi:hypothetical protein
MGINIALAALQSLVDQHSSKAMHDAIMEVKEYVEATEHDKSKEMFLLLANCGASFSRDINLEVAVTTEDEAKRYVAEKGIGFTHSYCKIKMFVNKDDALKYIKRG